MQFEWDENKRQTNLEKHGVDFPDAARVLLGRPLTRQDSRQEYGEQRFIAYGELGARLLAVAFTIRNEDVVRIISARKANARERRKYGGA
jgi:uncharacterized protein